MVINKQKGRVGDSSENNEESISTPLSEGELGLQQNRGEISVGTKTGNVVLEGTVLTEKRIASKLSAQYISSGTIDKQDDANIFEEVVGNEYKMANTDRFVNFDGNVIDTYGEELVVNGTNFVDSDLNGIPDGWSSLYGGATLSIDTEVFNFGIKAYGASNPEFSQVVTELTAGKTYEASALVYSGTLYGSLYIAGKTVGLTRSDVPQKLTIIFTASANSEIMYVGRVIAGLGWEAGNIYGNNISVREITTVDMTNDIPEVQVQDQAANGLVVQSSVNAGDYVVVDKEELVTNGTFDADTNWTKQTGWTIAGGVASNGYAGQALYQTPTNYIVGQKYIIKYEITSYTSGVIGAYISGGLSPTASKSSVGFHSLEFIPTVTNHLTGVIVASGANFVGSIDNISVQLKNDIYRADKDTADMYDYSSETSVEIVSGASVVKVADGHTFGGTVGNYYLRTGSTQSNYNLSTVNYSLSSFWQDLGSSIDEYKMSLLNPHFKDRTQFGITNKILATRRNDGTIKTEVCFVDTAIEDCGNAHVVMTDNGYSRIGNGLYSKGTDVVTPIGTWSTLNKGAYHPYFNAFGTSTLLDSSLTLDSSTNWYASVAYPAISTSECISYKTDRVAHSGTIVGSTYTTRPDYKFYDIIYQDQWIDLRIEANAVSQQDELNRVGTKAKSGGLDGIGGVVATYYYKDGFTIGTLGVRDNMCFITDTTIQNLGNFVDMTENVFNYIIGYVIINSIPYKINTIRNASDAYVQITLDESVNDLPTWNIATDTNASIILLKTLPHPSSGTQLVTDWIGNPNPSLGNIPTSGTWTVNTNDIYLYTATSGAANGTIGHYYQRTGANASADVTTFSMDTLFTDLGTNVGYPQAVKDRLASGLPMIGMNPLLVGQDGTDYTTGSHTMILSSKSDVATHTQVYSSNSGDTWTSSASVITNVSNTRSILDMTTPYTVISSYTAKIPTTQVSDPKAVKLVGNYATGTNSHSIYKGNQLVPTGKVNVGNGANGLESRVVENASVGTYDFKVTDGVQTLKMGLIIYCDKVINSVKHTLGHYYKYIYSDITSDISGFSLNSAVVATNLGVAGVTPSLTHPTITLDNSNSPAVKFIETIAEDSDGMAHYQVFAQEVKDNWDGVSTIIDGATGLTDGKVYKLTDTASAGNLYKLIGTTFTLANPTTWASPYDGDDEQFSQLTNGTTTDDNTKSIKTIVASTPLNKYFRRA